MGRIAIAHRSPRDVTGWAVIRGLADTRIIIRHAYPDWLEGDCNSSCRSMVDGCSDQIAFELSNRLRPGQFASVLVTLTMGRD